MTSPQTIIDVNASLGAWPFRRLRHNTPDAFVAKMDELGIDEAWVAAFDAVLNREPKTANIALAEAVGPRRGRLTPFAAVNPSFPTWDRDVDFYLRDLGMAGIRTYPNYYGYALDDACFGELLACVRERGVPLQVAVRVADERMHHPMLKAPAVELPRLEAQLENLGDAAIVLLNLGGPELAAVADLARERPNIFVEISHVEHIAGVGRLLGQFRQDQVLFGTHAPMLYPMSATLKLEESDLTDEQLDKICRGNARRILSGD